MEPGFRTGAEGGGGREEEDEEEEKLEITCQWEVPKNKFRGMTFTCTINSWQD
jgi:hypothetical protein